MRLEVNPISGTALPPGAPRPPRSMNEETVRVLLLEDSPSDALLIRETLGDSPGRFAVTHVERLAAAVEHLSRHEVDVILCDLGLPDAAGLEAAQGMRSAAPAQALIVMTRNNDEETAAEALRQGAQDYLIKGNISTYSILRSIRFAISRQRAQSDIELIRRRQLRLRDEFISNVSHELRSPLSAIHQFARILADEIPGALNEEQSQYTAIILKNAGQLAAMIDNLLEVTRIQAGKLTIRQQCMLPEKLVFDTVRSFQSAAELKGIRLCTELDVNLPPAYADPLRVRQVLENLLSNAVQFTPEGGTVLVRARLNPAAPAFLILEVSDTGCGIEPEVLQRVFERLAHAPKHDSAGRRGLGLGLYICRELVSRQGGNIWAESDFGKGATFRFTVPVYFPDDRHISVI